MRLFGRAVVVYLVRALMVSVTPAARGDAPHGDPKDIDPTSQPSNAQPLVACPSRSGRHHDAGPIRFGGDQERFRCRQRGSTQRSRRSEVVGCSAPQNRHGRRDGAVVEGRTDARTGTKDRLGRVDRERPGPYGVRALMDVRQMQLRLRVGLGSLLILWLSACQTPVPIPATLYTPEVAGIVTAVTPGPARIRMYTMTDGTVVTIDGAKATEIKGSGNASVGDLLLTDHTSTWLSSLRTASPGVAPAGCFYLPAAGVDDGDHIKFTNGLRLPKAAQFDPGLGHATPGGEYGIPEFAFCVDASGAVTKYGV